MANITLETIYNKLIDMGFKNEAIHEDMLGMSMIDMENDVIRTAIVDTGAKTVKIDDLWVESADEVPAKIENSFEIFKGSWHEFLEWEGC